MELELFLQDASFKYMLCGGYAVDMYLQCKTREHSDIDIGVFWEDREEVIRFMKSNNWSVYEALGGGIVCKLDNLENYDFERRKNLFCIRNKTPRIHLDHIEGNSYTFQMDDCEQSELDYVEFLFNECSNDKFVYYWNSEITRMLNKAIMREGRIPYLAPELVLLYKSTSSNTGKSIVDFKAVTEKMNLERKDWLKYALTIAYPHGHSWIKLV